ncbi:MAG: MFS transporter [Pirellulales bacterium]
MNSKWLYTVGGFLAFFAFGVIDNLKGPLLPEMLRGDGLSDSQAGAVVLAAYIGFVVATVASGFLADILTNRTVVWISGICLTFGTLGIRWNSDYSSILAWMAIIGYGLGSIELGANGLMIELHTHARGRYLNLLSVFHGCGSLIVPLVAAWLIQRGHSWQSIYAAALVLAVPLLVIFWPVRRVVSSEPSSTEARPSRLSARQLLYRGFNRVMLNYYVTIAAYVATELSVGAWLMEFLQRERQMSVSISSLYLSAFFVLLMLGRLIGAVIVEKLDYLVAVAVSLIGSMLCLAIGLWSGDGMVFFLSISGFCMSIAFPTLTAAVTRLHPQGTGSILGILFAAGGIGGAVGPWIVGLVSTAYGLQIGLSATLLFATLSLVGVMVARRFECTSPRLK